MGKWKYLHNDDHYTEKFEKIGKMRTRSKVSKSKKIDPADRFIMEESEWPKDNNHFAARVVEVHKRYSFVSKEPQIAKIDTNDVWLATVAKKFLTSDRLQRNFVCVGDRVLCRPADDKEVESSSDLPQSIILHMAPRKTKISRTDPLLEEREHVLASNIDQLIIVSSYLSPRVKWGLIDRYLVLAEKERITPIIVINKSDLLKEKEKVKAEFVEEARERSEYYRKLGYTVLDFQANLTKKQQKANESVQLLAELLKGKISLFSGHSGVGKSSIINLYNPQIVQEVEPDSDIFYKGRHTTTYASFIKLGIGGYVIDTPGIRSFIINEEDPIELSYGFVELRELMGKCKFRECRHVDEPGCAVIEAVEKGLISDWRYKNYVGILLKTTGREGRVEEAELE